MKLLCRIRRWCSRGSRQDLRRALLEPPTRLRPKTKAARPDQSAPATSRGSTATQIDPHIRRPPVPCRVDGEVTINSDLQALSA